jgi:hypothetical protein
MGKHCFPITVTEFKDLFLVDNAPNSLDKYFSEKGDSNIKMGVWHDPEEEYKLAWDNKVS